jgi:hypothetical protein
MVGVPPVCDSLLGDPRGRSSLCREAGLWLVVVAVLLGAYIVAKYLGRRLDLRRLGIETISQEALNGRLDAGNAGRLMHRGEVGMKTT